MKRWTLFCMVLLWTPMALADSLSGKWELQSLGKDRAFVLEQKGKELRAHRVMWPEFQGERYKLEHLYRGRVKGKKIQGELLVREEGMKKFEVLREFVGTLQADGSVILDGLPLKRVGKGGKIPKALVAASRPGKVP